MNKPKTVGTTIVPKKHVEKRMCATNTTSVRSMCFCG